MARTLSAAMQTALTASVVRPAFLVKIEFVGSTLYLASTRYDITWNAHTWLGNGMLFPFDGVEENLELNSGSVKIKLGSLDAALMSLLLASTNQSKRCEIYLGAFDSAFALIVDPVLIFGGYFETVQLAESSKGTIAELSYEDDLTKLNRPVELRWTDQCQKGLFPTDVGFQYVVAASDWKGFWGKAPKVKRSRKRKSTTGRA